MSDQKPPQGWYPDNQGTLRWWDGNQWTEHTHDPAQQVPAAEHDAAAATAPMPAATTATHGAAGEAGVPARPWFKKKRFIIPGAVLALMIVGGAFAGTETEPPAAAPDTSASTDADEAVEEAAEEEPAPEPEPEPEPEPTEPAMTAGQENAIGSAENYLGFKAFSRSGLIEQLEFEGYSTEDATFAVDYVDPNWMEQAARSAEEYLDFSSFSRSGLIDQLVFEGYSREQAEHGATSAGL